MLYKNDRIYDGTHRVRVIENPESVPEFRHKESRKKKCITELYSKILGFIDLYRDSISYEYPCTDIQISCCNKSLMNLCAYGKDENAQSMAVCRFIQDMINMNLISLESNYYIHTKEYHESKTYRYYRDNEYIFREYCKEHNIEPLVVAENIIRDETIIRDKKDVIKPVYNNKKKNKEVKNMKIKISAHLHWPKPDNLSILECEDYLWSELYNTYPWLKDYQIQANRMNETYYKEVPSMRHRFNPNITWNNKYTEVKKIGIRATNSLCGVKKEISETYDGILRQDILDRYGLNLVKDVKSSVPRITALLNEKKWTSEDTDLYEKIYEKLKTTYPDLPPFNTIRSKIKEEFMSIYFFEPDDLKDEKKRQQEELDPDKREARIKKKLGVNKNFHSGFQKGKSDEFGEEAYNFWLAIRAALGESYGSEIFFHESCIYMDVTDHLLKEGYFVWQVYDSWYAKKKGVTQEEFEKHVSKLVEKYANEYIEKYIA